MCDHKRLKCVDNVPICKDCGAILPLETLTSGECKAPAENAPESLKKPRKRAKKEG